MDTPSATEASGKAGRQLDGTFAPGNKCAQGNPYAKKAAELKSALYGAVTPQDMAEVIAAMLLEAKGGDVGAAQFLCDRLFGKAKQSIDLDGVLNVLKMYGKEAPAEEV